MLRYKSILPLRPVFNRLVPCLILCLFLPHIVRNLFPCPTNVHCHAHLELASDIPIALALSLRMFAKGPAGSRALGQVAGAPQTSSLPLNFQVHLLAALGASWRLFFQPPDGAIAPHNAPEAGGGGGGGVQSSAFPQGDSVLGIPPNPRSTLQVAKCIHPPEPPQASQATCWQSSVLFPHSGGMRPKKGSCLVMDHLSLLRVLPCPSLQCSPRRCPGAPQPGPSPCPEALRGAPTQQRCELSPVPWLLRVSVQMSLHDSSNTWVTLTNMMQSEGGQSRRACVM